jgi:hypothetical protein
MQYKPLVEYVACKESIIKTSAYNGNPRCGAGLKEISHDGSGLAIRKS